MRGIWRRLPDAVLPAGRLLGRVEAVLAGMTPSSAPVAGWSRTARDALVVGRSASAPPVDMAACARDGVEVVRRSSGGGPVLWDAGLLALDVWLPRGHPLAPDDVVEAYRALGEAMAAGLCDAGLSGARVVPVDEARRDDAPAGPADVVAGRACYGGVSPYEVVVGEGAARRKVVGLAQVRRMTGTVLQAGVLMSFDAPRLARLLERDGVAGDDVAGALAARATGLDRLLDGIDTAGVTAAVDARLAAVAGADLVPSAPSATEEADAARIATDRFRPLRP